MVVKILRQISIPEKSHSTNPLSIIGSLLNNLTILILLSVDGVLLRQSGPQLGYTLVVLVVTLQIVHRIIIELSDDSLSI